ncbi:MAG: DUF2953 domain-containing protein, partial [Methanobacterium sp.]|nr:DUF2953 domain-containing protein [Euryarchaeota archaeon]MBV1728843.1 DUF2953 domain-containing protein [Methanobacterium sp.]
MLLIPTILLILGFILLMVLLIPFHISLNLNKTGGLMEGTFKIKWLKITIINKKFPEKAKDETKDEKDKEKGKEKESEFSLEDITNTLHLLIQSRQYFLKFFKVIWDSFSIEKFKVHIILGWSSPADTAISMGYIWSAVAIFTIFPSLDFSARPDFSKERIDGNAFLKFKIQLIKPFLGLLWLLTKKPVRSLL